MKSKEEIRLKMVILLLWFLWSERNIIREEGRRRSAEVLGRSIRIYSDEIMKTRSEKERRKTKAKNSWSKPPEGVLKLNCDASFAANSQSGSWGFLIRDSEGEVALSGRGKVNHLMSAFHAELISCMHGVQAAIDLGIGNLILETDALLVQQEIISRTVCARPEGGLVEELKSLVSLNFLNFECVFKSRDCNKAAHALAALGSECVEGDEFISTSIPSDICRKT